jgi:RNA polymerase sigma-70 factor (ECF subfamily)
LGIRSGARLSEQLALGQHPADIWVVGLEALPKQSDRRLVEHEPHPAIVERARRRDPQAWAEIYERFSGPIYGFFLHALRDRQAAEDLTAGVFLEALEAAGRFSGDLKEMRAWLFKIGRHNLIDYFRRNGRARVVPIDDVDPAEIAASHPVEDPETAALRALSRQGLMSAVHSLSVDQKEVVLLRLAGELTSSEIAEVVGKSVGAVKALQHRAMAALAKALAREIDA